MKLWYGERKHPLLFVYVTLLMFYQWCDFWGFEINVDMIQYKICMHVYTASVALNIALLLKTEKKLSVWIFDFSRVTWLLWIMMHMHTYIHHYHYRHNWLTSTGMIYKWRGRESANQWLYEYKYLDRLYLVRKLLNWVKQIHHTAMNFQRHLPPRILRSTFHVFTVCMQCKQKAKFGDQLKGEQRCRAVNDQRARVTYSRASWALKAWWLEARYRLQLFVPFLALTMT